MAKHYLRRKLQTYQSLYHLNRAFAAISRHCWLLERAGFLPIVKMRVFRGLVRELQSLISHDITEHMHGIEDRDCFRYGKTRIHWEHNLNPARPALHEGRTHDSH